MIKCKFSDRPGTPQNNDFFRNMFTTQSYMNIPDYFRDISYGSWDLTGNRVDDTWYTMSITLEQARSRGRYGITQACVDAARVSTSGYFNVVTVVNEIIDAGFQGRVLLDPGAYNITILSHEMLHGFGFDHSFDDTDRRAAEWSQPGEYFDHWDIMSATNVYGFINHLGLASGPEMNAPLRMQEGWIPTHRIHLLVPGSVRRTVTLEMAALTRPESNGPLVIRVGGDDDDYYTIELRVKERWDQGIPRSTVLVHRVLSDKSILITQGGTERLPGSSFTFANGMRVTVNSINSATGNANVTITY